MNYTKAKDPYTMDINRTEEDNEGEKKMRKTYLTPQEWEHRHKGGLCFICSKKGLTKDCSNHPTVTTNTRKVVKESSDDDYKEFLEWKAFKVHQMKKKSPEPKKEESDDEDFA
ncbi:hypothetical protein BDR04DRAFT_1157246 [Suillus decipiens]|nr:hypothetical protein BDR04DRAFT_1157246 [Suillus decipiens]